jgi:hypothetical protein
MAEKSSDPKPQISAMDVFAANWPCESCSGDHANLATVLEVAPAELLRLRTLPDQD